MPADWATKLPDNASPYTSTIVFLVRKGNPKAIHDWPDTIKPGISVIAPNPKTSGGARWIFLAAYDYGLRANHKDDPKATAFVSTLYRNVPVLDSGSRGATTTFVERGLGDVLIGWENDALLSLKEHPGDYEIIVPSSSILAEPPVAVVTVNAAKHGTQPVAEAYLRDLYSPAAQKLACQFGFRPRRRARSSPGARTDARRRDDGRARAARGRRPNRIDDELACAVGATCLGARSGRLPPELRCLVARCGNRRRGGQLRCLGSRAPPVPGQRSARRTRRHSGAGRRPRS